MTFTRDWSHTRAHWPELMAELPDGARILEVGCFEGQATTWLLENVPRSVVTVIDPFNAANGQLSRFTENVLPYVLPREDRVDILVGRSAWHLPRLVIEQRLFDLVYVDGSHYPEDVLTDAVYAWPLVVGNGLMLFDDYDWPDAPDGQDVKTAVDAFVRCFNVEGAPIGADQYLVRA